MGLPLYQRSNGSVTDPTLDNAELVHESKGVPQRQLPNGSASDPPLGDARVVHEPNGVPLHQRPNGSDVDPLLDDAQSVHESNGSPLHRRRSVNDPLQGDAQVVHAPNDSPLQKRPNGAVRHPLLDDTQLVHEPNGSPLQKRPNGAVSHPLQDDTQLVHEPNGSPLQKRSNGAVSHPLQDNTQLVREPEQRDPHVVPTFTAESLTKPRSVVIYLPPLLSSLPQNLSVPPVSVDRPPLVTETRLPNIDPVSLSLHKALHHFGPLSEDYAGLPYADAFNWSDLELPADEEREWYAVVFRSRRKKGSDSDSLYDADRQAHEEAVSNGGLIMYWYGVPDPDTGMNLATCIWQSRKHAVAANSRPHHIRAMKLAAVSYEIYDLERYRLSKVKGEKGILVEGFSGEECGW